MKFDSPSVDKNTIKKLVEKVIKPNFMALELGTFEGQTDSVIGNMVKNLGGKVYTVDWFEAQSNGVPESYPDGKWENVCTPELTNERFLKFDNNIRELGLEDVVLPLKMKTDDAHLILKDNFFDFVFVDAAHNYTQVKKDIFNYFPKVKIGGIFCGHDFERPAHQINRIKLEKCCELDGVPNDPIHYGVVKAVCEVFKQYQYENCIWYLEKISENISDH